MSSPEYEKFEMNDKDIEDIYDPTRKKYRMSKNKTIYGIWADSEDEDDRDQGGFSSGKRKSRDYTAPVAFVSGGVKVGDKVTKIEEDEDDNADQDSDDEDEKSHQLKKQPTKVSKGFAGLKNTMGKEVGSWERHTKGIGQKLLEKMGHVPGKGLGKNLQGIATPIEAVQRKGRGAVGMYGTEKKAQPFPEGGHEEEEEEGEFKHKLRRWKKGEKEKISGKKYVTAEELIKSKEARSQFNKNSSSEMNSHLSKVKVIDMTGKEQRVLSGYQAISKRHNRPLEEDTSATTVPKIFNLPELLNNIELIIEMTEDRLIKNHRKLASEEDTLVNLDYELKKAKEACDEEESQISRLEEVIKILNECREVCINLALVEAMESCSNQLKRLKLYYQNEYLLYDLSSEVVSIITPSVMQEFKDWDPLKNPKQGTEVMAFIKEILSGSSHPYHQGFGNMSGMPQHMEPFDNLLWEVVMPKIRNAVSLWNIKQPHSMLEVIEHWRPLMPAWMMTNLLDQCIYMKLQIALDKWEPNKDHIPVQTWIQPWALIMGDRMSILYSMIRQKLGKTLVCWKPSDSSARVIISSWVGLFDQGHMDVFVVKHILPKLISCLQSISFSMQDEVCDQWKWVMDWLDIIPHQHMVDAVKENFFPTFLRTLSSWASSGIHTMVELNHWFTSWVAVFPDKLKSDPTIKGCFSEAVTIMNHGTRVPLQSRGSTQFYSHAEVSSIPNRHIHHTTTKERLEQICCEKGIPLLPMMSKGQNEQQIYKLGQLLIYFEGNFIYYFDNLRWYPTPSFEQIFSKAGL